MTLDTAATLGDELSDVQARWVSRRDLVYPLAHARPARSGRLRDGEPLWATLTTPVSSNAACTLARVNIKLESRDVPPLRDLVQDLRDGVRLLQVRGSARGSHSRR